MNCIFACKMFKANKNPDKIKAALSDPINSELIVQLKEYLDDEYIEDSPIEAPEQKPMQHSKETQHIIDSENHKTSSPSSFELSSHDAQLDDSKIGQSSPQFDQPDDSATAADADDSDVVEQSTQIDRGRQSDTLRTLLTSVQATSGISRMIIKSDELWIHYNDSTNLNNVMEPVIAAMNVSEYSNLQFNRLARTENAIVFSYVQ